MSKPGFYAVDPNTGEDIFVYYEDLEKETRKNILKPIGGFIFPAEAFSVLELSDVPFYVKDLLPKRGKAILYAPTKSGKSYFCLGMARAIGIGEPLIGLPTTKGKVLYIQFELGEEILQDRLQSTNKPYPNVWLGTSFSIKLDTTIGQKQIIRALDAVEPDVLILDPFYKAISGDENEATDVLEVLDFLDNMIEAYDCSIFMTHHSGKDLSKRGRGSSVMEDWVDSYLKMQAVNKKGENLKVKINTVFLRHAPLWEDPIVAELQDFEFVSIDGRMTIKQQVEKIILNSRDTVEVKQIFEKNIGSNASVYAALRELVNEGKITKEGWGKYGRAN